MAPRRGEHGICGVLRPEIDAAVADSENPSGNGISRFCDRRKPPLAVVKDCDISGLGEGLRFGKMLGGQRFPLLSPVRIGGGLLQTVFALLLVINRSFQKRLGVSRRRVLSP